MLNLWLIFWFLKNWVIYQFVYSTWPVIACQAEILFLVRGVGLEPTTSGLWDLYSNRLSYPRIYLLLTTETEFYLTCYCMSSRNFVLVGCAEFESATCRLKAECSTNWANIPFLHLHLQCFQVLRAIQCWNCWTILAVHGETLNRATPLGVYNILSLPTPISPMNGIFILFSMFLYSWILPDLMLVVK